MDGDPENLERLRDLADALYTLGDLLLEQGAVEEGLRVMEEGVEAARAVRARVPEESRAADWLCLAYEGVADAWGELGEHALSLKAAELGLEASLALVARDPADAWQRRLAAAYEKVGNVLGNTRVDEALPVAITTWRRLSGSQRTEPKRLRLRSWASRLRRSSCAMHQAMRTFATRWRAFFSWRHAPVTETFRRSARAL